MSLAKARALLRVYLRETFAYPAISLIWILADTVTALVLPAVWMSASGPGGNIAGFTHRDIATYYLVSMVLTQFITCHLMWDIGWDIREGAFSAQIVRPFPFLLQCTLRNLAWRSAKLVLFLPIAGAFYLIYLGVGPASPLHWSWQFLAAVVFAHGLSFLAAYCMALTALWTVEFQNVLEMYYVPEQILSGRILPLAMLPAWAMGIGGFLHFRYTVAFPAELLMGKLSQDEAWKGFLAQAAWIAAFYVLGKVLLRRGMRRYSGVGM